MSHSQTQAIKFKIKKFHELLLNYSCWLTCHFGADSFKWRPERGKERIETVAYALQFQD